MIRLRNVKSACIVMFALLFLQLQGTVVGVSDRARIRGDVDFDGILSVKDATAIQKHLVQLEYLANDNYKLADINLDGSITVRDATYIQKVVAGIIISNNNTVSGGGVVLPDDEW